MDKDELLFDFEIKTLSKSSQETVNETKRFTEFLIKYITTTKEFSNTLREKLKTKDCQQSLLHESILLTNIVGIYDSFQSYLQKVTNLMLIMKSEIIEPLEDFHQSQIKVYNDFLQRIGEVNMKQKIYKSVLDKAKINYYKEAYYSKEEQESNDFKEDIFNGEKNSETLDILLKNKMRVKLYETIYNYELFRYNKKIDALNKDYNNAINQIKIAEKTRIYFTKSSFDKFRNYMATYIKNINDFLYIVEKYTSENICQKDEKFWINEASKYKKNDNDRIPQEKFVSFNDYLQKNNNEKKNIELELFKNEIEEEDIIELDSDIFDDKQLKAYINEIMGDLRKEEEISLDKIARLIELFQKNKKNDSIKLFLDSIVDKKKNSMKFNNLKNLKHLANIISFITLKEDSIFKGNFELNFKIIYIAERVYYQNKSNNNKVYLSAILSKNKYFRTKQFWRNIIELKLANKLCDHIKRLRNLNLPEERKKSFFGKIGNDAYANAHKFSLLSKSRILPLIKYYNEIEPSKIGFIDKMATQEMLTILRESIQSSSNFNFPTDTCMDLVAKLAEEYKINKENIKFFVLYTNICSCTVRKRLTYDKQISSDFTNSLKDSDKNLIKIKLLANAIPYLAYKDYYNLLLCSKLCNKKLKKKIYSYILKQDNISKKIRLKIWGTLLDLPKIKKKYNYEEILNHATDQETKEVILLDVVRTSINGKKPADKEREKLTNVLYAASQVNNGIKYCQGMNYLVKFLLDVFDEDESFYIFISLFESTEYSIIFTKDLQTLKAFFYVFKRIISLYEPELASFLNSCGIDFNFFLPPWFITLFTGSHQHHNKENDDNSNIMIRILDNFITYGWKSLMEFSCVILHFYETYIMNIKYDHMMQFLINDILKSDFFAQKNKELIEKSLDFYKIKKKLIKNIEAEYEQNMKLKDTMN